MTKKNDFIIFFKKFNNIAMFLTLAFLSLNSKTAHGIEFPLENNKLQDINPPDVIQWIASSDAIYYSDNIVKLALRLSTKNDFATQRKHLKIEGPSGFDLIDLQTPPAEKGVDVYTGEEIDVFKRGNFDLTFKTRGIPDVSKINIYITYLGCATSICLFPYTETLSVPLILSTEPSGFVTPQPQAKQSGIHAYLAEKISDTELGLGLLLLLVFIGGLLTNLTPCVYPMIPITIRILANQKASNPFVGSSLYALGIMITYTLLGLVAALSGSMFGHVMTSTWVNIIFACLMGILALSMLGFANLTSLQTLGNKIGNLKGASSSKVFLMGIAAGFVAAPCTGPVLAALLTFTANQQSVANGVKLLVTYSAGFALPYIFLGIASNKIASFKFSHKVQNSVKLIFSAIMFALMLYFLRIPAYQVFVLLRGYWGVIALTTLTLNVLIFALWIFKKTLYDSKYFIILPSIILGICIFGTTQWLVTPPSNINGGELSTLINWIQDEDQAFELAKEQGKPILIDNWAEWCEACKVMDVLVFTNEKLVEEINNNWIALKIDLSKDNKKVTQHKSKYGIKGLPMLIMIPSDGDISKKESIIGYINSTDLLQKLKDIKF